MERICTDRFWDTNLTWGNHRTHPEFTDCFQYTVFLWLPSLWLWVTAPIYVYILLQLEDGHVPWNWKSLTKISISVLQFSVRYLQLGQTDDGAWDIRYSGLFAEGITLFVVMLYIDLERRKGFVTSGIQTIYWFLASLCGTVLLYSKMVKQDYDGGCDEIVMMKTYLSLSIVQFVLTWFADIRSEPQLKRDCKLSSASFISRCTFAWFGKFMSIGYQRTITTEDISHMMPSGQSKTVIPHFEHIWASEENRLNKNNRLTDKKPKINLLTVIIKANWPILLGANLLKLASQVFIMSRPFITGLLVGFAADLSQPGWKGYVYVLAGITCILGDDSMGNYVEHLCASAALQLRVCLKSAVYKKSMRMSNKARTESTVGEIVNVMNQDCDQVQCFIGYFFWIWCVPFEFVASFLVLYFTVDYAALVSVCVLAVVMPLNIWMARHGHNTHLARMDKKDNRIKLMTEIMNGIKILKLYAWEMAFGEKVLELRNDELSILRKQQIYGIICTICWHVAPFLMTLVTFAVFVHISADHMLTAETAFRALATFGMLTHTFNALPHIICHFLRSFVSIRRLEKFLNNDEIEADIVTHHPSEKLEYNIRRSSLKHTLFYTILKQVDAIQIEDGTFTWDDKLGPCLKNINMSVPKGSLVAVVGTVGSGKSSLLSAILGEMEKNEGNVNVHGSIAYVPQQAWIQNDTLKDNVLFGHKYREHTYNNVIDACALRRDLEILSAKDMTEIGEKGINLSGGQKQRVSMARAVYFNSEIYLLDDPLSAVDAHVGKDIFNHVISDNGLLKNKTRVLVTHGITWLPYVDKIIVIENGAISETGTYQQLMSNEGAFATFIQKYRNDGHISDDEDNTTEVLKTVERKQPDDSVKDGRCDLVQSSDNCEPSAVGSCSLESDSGYTTDSSASSTRCTSDVKENESKHRQEMKHRRYRRSISRLISLEEKHKTSSNTTDTISGDIVHDKKSLKIATFDDKNNLNEERIKRESDKVDTGKLIDEEEIETGKVQFRYLFPYFKAIGLRSCILTVVFFVGFKVCEIAQTVLIKEWTDDESLNNLTSLPGDSEDRYGENLYFIKIYALIGVLHCVTCLIQETFLVYGVLRAAKIMHENMLRHLLRGPMAFFDTTPVGRIVQRFSGDIEPLDGAISGHTNHLLHCIVGLLSVFVVIMSSLPKFIIMAIPIFFIYNEIHKRFVPVRRQLSRIESKQNSPVASHFTESLNGVHVIRAFGMQEQFALQSARKIDETCETNFHNKTVDRWMNIRLAFMNALCFAATTYLAIEEREYLGGAVIGMAINYVLQLNGHLEGFVRISGDMESDVVSIERIGQYTSIKQEAPAHTSVVLDKSWPASGKVEVDNYSVRYREGLDLVLKNIHFQVKPGEKVGIVGRTGAGKSSLTLGLFRLIEPAEGSIHIDEHDISKLGLFDLRSNLTILPQEPVLFSGTLKSNLDPLNVHTDNEIFTALEHSHLKTFIDTLPDKLNYDCGEGGQNLSVGQRQLICLARSLLRKSNVLVLDEATAAVDMKTDELIQNTIKMEFKDCTVLTIAHRLNTIIDYDRILVLENGEVTEFDTPSNLLENKDSAFYSMAKDARLVK